MLREIKRREAVQVGYEFECSLLSRMLIDKKVNIL